MIEEKLGVNPIWIFPEDNEGEERDIEFEKEEREGRVGEGDIGRIPLNELLLRFILLLLLPLFEG